MFNRARLKLTAWYLLIIMTISLSFSVVIYRIFSREFERFGRIQRFRIEHPIWDRNQPYPDIDQNGPLPFIDPDLLAEIRHRLIFVLIFINSAILVVSGGLGYFLAGKTLQPIKDMIDDQNQFISDASHELRTPLTSLKTAMEVSLRDKNLTLDNSKILIKDSIAEVDRLHHLSQNLLQLSQHQKPDDVLTFTKIKLSAIIQEATKKILPLSEKRQIKLSKDIEDVQIKGDRYQLVDLLVILLDNAIKYSPQKTTITIIAKKTDHKLKLQITDQGIGIAKKDIPNLFSRFFRADTARSKSKIDGFGLGLAIAKKIVESHQGTINITSQLNKGTTVTIYLPIFS